MHVARKWQLKPRAVAQALPAQPTSLTPALQGMLPLSQDFMADPAQFTFTVVQRKVLVEAAQHHREVLLLFASQPMPMRNQPLAGASEKLPATLGAGDVDECETPAPIRPTDMLKTEELDHVYPA
jgi:hypothetical protein